MSKVQCHPYGASKYAIHFLDSKSLIGKVQTKPLNSKPLCFINKMCWNDLSDDSDHFIEMYWRRLEP